MRQLYKPKITKGFGCSLCGVFLPKNTLYMRVKDGYMWVAAYEVANCKGNKFVVNVLTTNAKYPQRMRISSVDGLGLLFVQAVKDIDVKKPVPVVNKQTLGNLLPKNQMVSKAYKACAVYACAKETKVKRELYNV